MAGNEKESRGGPLGAERRWNPPLVPSHPFFSLFLLVQPSPTMTLLYVSDEVK